MAIKTYCISKLDLYRYVQRGELIPIEPTGGFVPCPDRRTKSYVDGCKLRLKTLQFNKRQASYGSKDFLDAILESKQPSEFNRQQIEAEIAFLEQEIKKYENDPRDPFDWKTYQLPSSKDEAVEILEFLSECFYRLIDINKIDDGKGLKPSGDDHEYVIDYSGRKSLRKDQKHRLAVRAVAKDIWEKEPHLTMVDMAKRSDLIKACNGKQYHFNTIRRWIKDLNPNSNPGRRKKNKIKRVQA
ncbi:hypothetical protein [uncultured Desulfosarcina sp.]|uniref:hypothetical protein n=1 Tax=uncultured Desulfosarcina sp. TaxID=218289 RepID=UPI0029C77961|nr:hypothetical protein [uncultured Desulfosarcina sp.]